MGAQMVDLVAHSMGGLVARVYIAQVMDERDVAQLIMLGTPNGGSPCARLPVSLGFAVPASLELRPNYVRNVLNPQVTERRDVPFSMLAGTPINDAFRSPCTRHAYRPSGKPQQRGQYRASGRDGRGAYGYDGF